jgi:O-antigen ligase
VSDVVAVRPEPARALVRRRPPLWMQVLLAGLAAAAFMTGTKLLPTAHNFGPFEVITSLLLLTSGGYALRRGIRPRANLISALAAALLLVSALSLLKVRELALWQALLELAVFAFLVAVLFILYNTGLTFLGEFPRFLRAVSWAGVMAGAWVVLSSARAGWSIMAMGPFRNRAHMGIYLLTVFWIILLAVTWPGQAPYQRLVLALSLPLVLYGIASSGRRSVYLSLFVGMVVLAVVLWAAGRRRKWVVAGVLIVSASFLGTLLEIGENVPEQMGFYRLRVAEVIPHLRVALGREVEGEDSANTFFLQQRSGTIQAFLDNPVLGIGFGAYVGSPYPGSMFELHSTPLRFLAETGMVGIATYVAFMAALLLGSVRVARRAWDTPFREFALVFAVAWWSLAISYGYNRHTTERTFWLLLAMFLVFDAYLARWVQARSYVRAAQHASDTVPRAAPGERRGRSNRTG